MCEAVMPRTSFPVLTISFLSLAAFAACEVTLNREPARTETLSVDLDETEGVDVALKAGAGEINIRGGSAKLMNGEFTFSPVELRPEIDCNNRGSRGRLVINCPPQRSFSRTEMKWNLRLNDQKPIDLDIQLGAGESRLELGSLDLRGLEVQMGAGTLQLDLRGTPMHDYDVNLRGGVGEVMIYLPQNVGILAHITGGLGDIRARGLEKRDGQYINKAYGTAKTTVRFDIKGGIGSIRLEGD